MQFFGKTDTGMVRDDNQDSFFAGYLDIEECGIEARDEKIFLAIICDGMGGANGGNIASKLTVETFTRELSAGLKNIISERLPNDTCETILSYAIHCANKEVYDKAQENPKLHGMGTTLVAMLLFRETVYIANVGDSGIFCISDNNICKITRDHSYVQTLIDKGEITEEEAQNHPNKNVIMRAIGTDVEVVPDFLKIHPDRKDFLLCSDGLSNYLDKEKILSVINENLSPDKTVEKMIKLANAAGGGDNITAIFVKS